MNQKVSTILYINIYLTPYVQDYDTICILSRVVLVEIYVALKKAV